MQRTFVGSPYIHVSLIPDVACYISYATKPSLCTLNCVVCDRLPLTTRFVAPRRHQVPKSCLSGAYETRFAHWPGADQGRGRVVISPAHIVARAVFELLPTGRYLCNLCNGVVGGTLFPIYTNYGGSLYDRVTTTTSLLIVHTSASTLSI